MKAPRARRKMAEAEALPVEPIAQLPARIEPGVPALREAPRVPAEDAFRRFDRYLHALMGRSENGISPLSLGMAWMDWAAHLAFSPGRQAELLWKAAQDGQRLAAWAAGAATGDDPGPAPAKPDRRFSAPEWNRFPFAVWAQRHLLAEQRWKRAVSDLPGADKHHLRLVDFYGRQMLDMLSPSNFLATNPQLIAHTVDEGGANLMRGAQYWVEDAVRKLLRVDEHSVEFTPGEEVAATKGEVVYHNRLIELIQYAPTTGTVKPVPLLLVPAWIMKYYILDLTEQDSLVKWLVDRGFTVFCISWKNPGPEDRDLGFDDYRKLGVMAALDAVTAITGAPKVQGLGYCLGGTLLAVSAAVMAQNGDNRLASMSMLAAQVDFDEAGELSLFTNEDQLALLEDMMWEQGVLGKEAMAGTFSMLKSQDLIWSKMVREYVMGERELPSALGAWSDDATRMPYRMHSEYLRWLFLDNDLAEGRMQVGGNHIFLQDIKVPVFAVATERDHIAPWTSVYKLTWLLRSPVTFALASGGHNTGIVAAPGNPKAKFRMMTHVPGRSHPGPSDWAAAAPQQPGSWWPAWADWLSEQDRGEPVAPPPMGNAGAGYPVLYPAPGKYVMQR
ncbi:PHA/PHB synthase family protein [Paenirhodobacter sp.]|uniref:PHA/PHB synthase family protein n=1 Tax=Paenirhodobacter sp. TaxID=1965326 RepID=UPI003B41DB67